MKIVITVFLGGLVALSGCLAPAQFSPAEDGPAEALEPLLIFEPISRTNLVHMYIAGPFDGQVVIDGNLTSSHEGYPPYEPPEWGVTPTNFSAESRVEYFGMLAVKQRGAEFDIIESHTVSCGMQTPENLKLDASFGPVQVENEYFVGGALAASGGCEGVFAPDGPIVVPPLAEGEAFHFVSFATNLTGRLASGNHAWQVEGSAGAQLGIHLMDFLEEPEIVQSTGLDLFLQAKNLDSSLGVKNTEIYRWSLESPGILIFGTMGAATVGFAEWYFSVPDRDPMTFHEVRAAVKVHQDCLVGCEAGFLPWLAVGGPGEWEVGLNHYFCAANHSVIDWFGCEPRIFVIPLPGDPWG